MTRFISARSCERFYLELDEETRSSCVPLLAQLQKQEGSRDCSLADVTLTTIPAKYIGVRDRPYLNELTSSAKNGEGWLSHLSTASK
jgi:hypothetical protein